MGYGSNTGTHGYGIYALDDAWSAGDMTWATPWEKAGGIGFDTDEKEPDVKVTPTKLDDGDKLNFDITDIVKDWVSGSVDNNGVMIHAPNERGKYIDDGDEAANSEYVYALFYSKETDETDRAPKLKVTVGEDAVVHSLAKSGLDVTGVIENGFLSMDVPFEGQSVIKLYSVNGAVVQHFTVERAGAIVKECNLTAGVYLLAIENGENVFTGKMQVK